MPNFQDNFGPQPPFTWTCGEDIPDCDKSTARIQPSVENSSNVSGSHYEIITVSRDKGSQVYGLGSVCIFPNHQRLQTIPASLAACKHCFGKELSELADGSHYDVNACCYYRLPADSYAAIDLGKQEETPVMHAVISGPTSALTGGESCLSYFCENITTPPTQLSMDSEVRVESVLILESTQSSHNGAIVQEMLGASAVECIQISATDSNICNSLQRLSMQH